MTNTEVHTILLKIKYIFFYLIGKIPFLSMWHKSRLKLLNLCSGQILLYCVNLDLFSPQSGYQTKCQFLKYPSFNLSCCIVIGTRKSEILRQMLDSIFFL